MRYLLDTNIISLNEHDIYLSVITIGEIKFGIQKVKSQSRKKQLLLWLEDNLLQRFKGKIIVIDIQTMLRWGEINQYLQSIGRPISVMDSLIAATSVTKDMTLVTRNVKDFSDFDIEIINPFM